MTEQEWEDIQAEELQQNVNSYVEYLLDEGLATHAKVLNLKTTETVWRNEYGLSLKQAAKAWDKAYGMRMNKEI